MPAAGSSSLSARQESLARPGDHTRGPPAQWSAWLDSCTEPPLYKLPAAFSRSALPAAGSSSLSARQGRLARPGDHTRGPPAQWSAWLDSCTEPPLYKLATLCVFARPGPSSLSARQGNLACLGDPQEGPPAAGEPSVR